MSYLRYKRFKFFNRLTTVRHPPRIQVQDDDVLDVTWSKLADSGVDCSSFDTGDYNYDIEELTTKIEQRLSDGRYTDGSPPIGLS